MPNASRVVERASLGPLRQQKVAYECFFLPFPTPIIRVRRTIQTSRNPRIRVGGWLQLSVNSAALLDIERVTVTRCDVRASSTDGEGLSYVCFVALPERSALFWLRAAIVRLSPVVRRRRSRNELRRLRLLRPKVRIPIGRRFQGELNLLRQTFLQLVLCVFDVGLNHLPNFDRHQLLRVC